MADKLILVLISAAAVLPAQQLSVDDRLLVRESQLQFAQAHIQMAQAQANAAKAELSLTQLIFSLKEKYKCEGPCALDDSLKFVQPPKPAAPRDTPDSDTSDSVKEQNKGKPK